jgi:hypothetical protein
VDLIIFLTLTGFSKSERTAPPKNFERIIVLEEEFLFSN